MSRPTLPTAKSSAQHCPSSPFEISRLPSTIRQAFLRISSSENLYRGGDCMDDALRQELSAASSPEDKAAVVAEVLFDTFPEEMALLARWCSLLHWFDAAIVEAL